MDNAASTRNLCLWSGVDWRLSDVRYYDAAVMSLRREWKRSAQYLTHISYIIFIYVLYQQPVPVAARSKA